MTNRRRRRMGSRRSSLSEEELLALKMRDQEHPAEKLGDYFRDIIGGEDIPTLGLDEHGFKGLTTKDVVLGKLTDTDIERLEALERMSEWLYRGMIPCNKESPVTEFEALNQRFGMLARLTRGRGGFEREMQSKQISKREVATSSDEKEGRLKRFLSF